MNLFIYNNKYVFIISCFLFSGANKFAGLVAYFTSPETDVIDAVAGASRVIVDGDLCGNTEYMAGVIREATGADLFRIRTTHNYPGTHKELIDFAKVESDSKARPEMATHTYSLDQYDVGSEHMKVTVVF